MGVAGGRFVRLTTFSPSVSRLYRRLEILQSSQTYSLPHLVSDAFRLFSVKVTHRFLQPYKTANKITHIFNRHIVLCKHSEG
jgi:hypothetical protein